MLGADVQLLFDLAGLPAVRLRRPRAWVANNAAASALAGVPGHA
jgi:hypothetical protein